MSELRDQHKAFAEWFLQQNTVAPNAEDLAWAAWKAALAQPEAEPEPVAWQVRWIDPEEGPGAWRCCLDPSEADYYANREDHDWRPLYAHPPRDEWREAAEEALRWMEHARLHLTIKERMHPDGLSLYDSAAEALRAALAQPEAIGPEWTPCVKLPVTVHVREQRPGEQHVSTREGITPVKPDDLIMRGVAGEEYPIGRELFEKTYRIGAHPPRDEWRPASEPPEDGRDVLVWVEYFEADLAGPCTLTYPAQGCRLAGHGWQIRGWDFGDWVIVSPGDGFTVLGWRDVEPPTED